MQKTNFEISKSRHCTERKLKKVKKTKSVEVLTVKPFHVSWPLPCQSPHAGGIDISLVKNRVYGPRKDIFHLYRDAQYSMKFPARVVSILLFLPIYVIMTSFPQKLAKRFTFVDF